METKTTTAISTVKREVRLREWATQIETRQASGMTVQQWCAENKLSSKTYLLSLAESPGAMRCIRTGNRTTDDTGADSGYSHRKQWITDHAAGGYCC